ncbi:MAG: hypothetical protein AVDCRST_MAG64-1378, partial [uncultured Phycisphaerae bacterium]
MTEGFCRRLLCAATAAAACALVIGMPPVVARAQDADPPPQAAGPAAETGIPPSPWDDVAIDFGVRDEDVPPPTPVNETPARTVELLAAAMNEATGPRRARLLAEIAGCKLPQSVPHVRAAIDDPDPLVRREAVRSAGVLADATLRDTLGKFLADPDPAVRRDALLAAHAIDTAGDSSARSPAVAAA